MTDILRKRLIKEEGFRLWPYQDTKGIWTIGVGHNVEADPEMKPRLGDLMKFGITRTEAYSLLDRDIKNAETDLEELYPWVSQLNEARREVLVDMMFNMGKRKLFQFHNTMAMIKDGRFHDAAENLKLSLWYKQVGDRAINLCRILDAGAV